MELALAKTINNYEANDGDLSCQLNHDDFFIDVVKGFSQPQKSLSPKYFYDETGSEYFDQICDLDEYYPYQTELSLLPRVAEDMRDIVRGDCSIIEFGAGSLQKIRPLFESIEGVKQFIPIDISGEFLREQVKRLQQGFPNIDMLAVEADFSQPVKLPTGIESQKIGFFPGSTIGNFTPEQAGHFLENALETLGENGRMLIGVDTKKSPSILHDAYNDTAGVTGKFNLNVLERINRELAGNIDIPSFEHYAFYNANKGCIEMHLVCKKDQLATIGGMEFKFAEGESIHTESSYKYTPEDFSKLAGRVGWSIEKSWIADESMFSMFLLKPDIS